MNGVLQDLRYSLRQLRKNPGFTVVCILTLALGIGVNTSVFSAVNGLLVRKPPVRDPSRVVVISSVNPAKDVYASDRTPVSALDYYDWRAQSSSFTSMGGCGV